MVLHSYQVDFFAGQIIEVEADSVEAAIVEAVKESGWPGEAIGTDRGQHLQVWVRRRKAADHG